MAAMPVAGVSPAGGIVVVCAKILKAKIKKENVRAMDKFFFIVKLLNKRFPKLAETHS
jgi:hypothetical protein